MVCANEKQLHKLWNSMKKRIPSESEHETENENNDTAELNEIYQQKNEQKRQQRKRIIQITMIIIESAFTRTN